MHSTTEPTVSLGVPVYNGGEHFEPALRGLLAQDYPKLEILISDNASTDGTEQICRAIAANDSRVRYVRQTENIGAGRNFEFVAHESKGDLFAWCAHDDIRKPGFVSACVAEMLKHPSAVVCNSAVEFLDEAGSVRPDWHDRNFSTIGMSVAQRALRLIDHMDWVDMYGLIRRDALERCLPMDPVWGADVVFSMKLLMLGDFLKVDRRLFQYRVRSKPKKPAQVMRDVVHKDYQLTQPYTQMIRALLAVPMQAVTSEKVRGEILLGFLRIISELEPTGPHPCWRDILLREHKKEKDARSVHESFARRLMRWIGDVVPGGEEEPERTALRLALLGSRTALIAVANAPTDEPLGVRTIDFLRRKHAHLTVHVLCPAESTAAWRAIAGVENAHSFARVPAAGDDDRVRAELRTLAPDVAICVTHHRTTQLDHLIAGSGATLRFAFSRPSIVVARHWYGRPKETYRPDAGFTHVLTKNGDDTKLFELLGAST